MHFDPGAIFNSMQNSIFVRACFFQPMEVLEEEYSYNMLFAGYLSEDVDKKMRDVDVELGSESG